MTSPPQNAPDVALASARRTPARTGRSSPPACCASPVGSPRATPTRWSGTSSPVARSTGSPSRRSALPSWSATSPPRAVRTGPVSGTSAATSPTPTPRLTANDVQTDLDNGVTSRLARGRRRAVSPSTTSALLSRACSSTSRRWSWSPTTRSPLPRRSPRLAAGSTLAEGTNLGADPLGSRLRGNAVDLDATISAVAATATDLGCRALVVDGTAVHDLGASDVQELGLVARRRRCLPARVGRRPATRSRTPPNLIEFRYAATDEQFPTIAKLRAARRLLGPGARAQRRRAEGRRQRQHAVTSRPMMTKYDPWVNMLRTCVAAFSAGVGGADAVTVLPFDAHLGLPDAFSRRIARNTSALLIHEAHLARVADPAGGAFADREADRRPGRRRLGRVRRHRGGRRCCRRGRRRLAAGADRAGRHRARAADRAAQAAAHRALRVPEPDRDPARASSVRGRRPQGPRLGPRLRGAARRTRPGPSSWPPWAPSPRTPRAPPSPATCSQPAASPPSTRAATTTSPRCWRRTPARTAVSRSSA